MVGVVVEIGVVGVWEYDGIIGELWVVDNVGVREMTYKSWEEWGRESM